MNENESLNLFDCVFVFSLLVPGLQSSFSLKSLRQAPAQSPVSAVCLKACRGLFVSWLTSCSRTSQSSLCLVSLCEQIQLITAVH